MKILINTAHQRFGGAIQVALSFIYECRQFPEHEYHVWVGPGVGQFLQEEDFPPNFQFRHFNFGVIGLKTTFRINRELQAAEREIQPDVIISTSGPTYFHSRAPQVIGFNLPLYIYPESPFVQQIRGYRKARMLLKKRLHYYFFKRDALAYVVQTDDVNERVRRALRTEKVYTVTNTHNGFYNDWRRFPAKLPPRKKGEFRFLTLSAWYPHKNLELIPKVLDILQRQGLNEVTFVLTLPQEAFRQHFGGPSAMQGLINIGPVKPEECPSLYDECDGMFLPTLAECFSASYPEAMVMKKPIITTDLGFAQSICGDAALFFEPQSAEDAAAKIVQLTTDSDLQYHLIQQGIRQLSHFDSPQQRARKYLTLCQELARGIYQPIL